MSKLSDELRTNRESDDYTEDDLDRWVKQLKELQKELEIPSDIKIVEDKSSSFYLIRIKKRNVVANDVIDLSTQNVARSAEKFSEVTGPIVLSEDGYSATCTSKFGVFDDSKTYSRVCGSLLYSSGIHLLRFRINTSRSNAFFVGIITSTETIADKSSALKSVYGYRDDGASVMAGFFKRAYRKIETQPNDEVLLILDCSATKIRYLHLRTGQLSEMEVEQQSCPLPWKLVVTLRHPGDEIKILNF
jgi:hypothetical protein